MNRQEYLSDPHVRAFIEWVTPRLCTEGLFTHSYRRPRKDWSCASIFDAYLQYDWRGDFVSNERTLEALRLRLRAALSDGDPVAFIAAGTDVLRWGGVLANNERRLSALGDEVIPIFRSAVRQLEPAHADTDRIADVRFMNSGFTKLYALLIDGFPIYDGRVGAALGYLVRRYLQERQAISVPDVLRFPWGAGQGFRRGEPRKNRNPSSGELIFPRFTSNVRRHTQANIMAAWLLGELSRSGCFGELPEQQRLWALQSAVFMIGYEIPLG